MRNTLRIILALALIGGLGGCAIGEPKTAEEFGGGLGGNLAAGMQYIPGLNILSWGADEHYRQQQERAGTSPTVGRLYQQCLERGTERQECDAQFGRGSRGVAGIE